MFQKKGNRQRKIVVIRRLISFLFCLRIGQEETITRPPDLLLGGADAPGQVPSARPTVRTAHRKRFPFLTRFRNLLKWNSSVHSFVSFIFFNEENKFSRMNEWKKSWNLTNERRWVSWWKKLHRWQFLPDQVISSTNCLLPASSLQLFIRQPGRRLHKKPNGRFSTLARIACHRFYFLTNCFFDKLWVNLELWRITRSFLFRCSV